MVDSGKAIREILLLNASVTSLLQTDQNSNFAIYVGNDLPEHFDPKNGPAILISRRGGHADPEIAPLSNSRVQIKVAADVEKYLPAFQVYQALFNVLQGISQTGLDGGTVLINSIIETTAAQELSDPDTGWCYVIGFWNVLATDVVAVGPAGGNYAPNTSVFATKAYVDAETARAEAAEASFLSTAENFAVVMAIALG